MRLRQSTRPLRPRPIVRRRDRSTAFRKLDPRHQVRNPVMFVVEVGSVAHDALCRPRSSPAPGRSAPGFILGDLRSGCGSPCCSPTSPRRWPRAAARRRPRRSAQGAPRRAGEAARRDPQRRRDTSRPCGIDAAQGRRRARRGRRRHPGRRRGRSRASPRSTRAPSPARARPSIRESGGDRSAVTGGTRVLSDWLVVRITAEPRRDLPRPHDRDGRGREAPEDAERDRARHPARRRSRSSSCSRP